MSGIQGPSLIQQRPALRRSMYASARPAGTSRHASFFPSHPMTFVCLWIPDWSTDAASIAEPGDAMRRPYPHPPALDRLTESLLRIVPRVKVGAGLIWADARGLPERTVAERLCATVARARS